MRVLLDTHTFLWFITGDDRLPAKVRKIIDDPSCEKFVSLASCWEIAIKFARGRLELDITLEQLLNTAIEGNGLVLLDIERRHLLQITALASVHGDPFDRLIVAQAKIEKLVQLSNDQTLDAYGINRVW